MYMQTQCDTVLTAGSAIVARVVWISIYTSNPRLTFDTLAPLSYRTERE